ncbi:MAG: hypothetical protein DCC69_11140 [Hyphomicrobiales bacterium]|nr:MAG: hypothetical protein DCC69_11140 [Hyphomicrobiales bacterium]
MTYRILVAAALSLGLGTAVAMAQTDPAQPGASPGVTASPQLPTGWEGPIADAFFADQQMGTLRSQEEVRSNWEALSDEQQAQVRSDCSTMDTAGTQTDDDMTTGSTTPDSAAPGTTPGATPGEAVNMAAVEQVCDWIDAM